MFCMHPHIFKNVSDTFFNSLLYKAEVYNQVCVSQQRVRM